MLGGVQKVGPGGTLQLTAPITNDMKLEVGMHYTLSITAVFDDGTSAGASTQVTAS